MILGSRAAREAGPTQPPLLINTVTGWEQIAYATIQRWLDLPWPADLCFTAALWERIGIASGVVSGLVGLVAEEAIVIPMAMEIFGCKVEAVLQYPVWEMALGAGTRGAEGPRRGTCKVGKGAAGP